jgi:orotate phosphoribosyltransferase
MEKIIALQTAEALMQINAIKLNARHPFTWASGLRAPIYCDNRRILSFPAVRQMVAGHLSWMSREKFPHATVVAGVATGAIAHGVLVAEQLEKPFVYVRSAAKGHGLANRIEGHLPEACRVVVIEDLVSTGKSSLEAVTALREAGADVLGMVAIFSYELPQATEAFNAQKCMFYSLSNYSSLLKAAVSENRISASDYKMLDDWKNDPVGWSAKYE